MKRLLLAASLVATLTGTVPAYALMCSSSSEGITLGFGFQLGEPFTERERAEVDLSRLRQAGVDATRVERWSGCLRAFVRLPGGGQEMQFFEPRTLERVR